MATKVLTERYLVERGHRHQYRELREDQIMVLKDDGYTVTLASEVPGAPKLVEDNEERLIRSMQPSARAQKSSDFKSKKITGAGKSGVRETLAAGRTRRVRSGDRKTSSFHTLIKYVANGKSYLLPRKETND